MNKVKKFSGKYNFLSNFWFCNVELDGEIYPSVEHAYQAAKTTDAKMRKNIRSTKSPSQAKKIGNSVKLRSDWEDVKISIMKDLIRKKFSHPTLKKALLDTGSMILEEGNNWGDSFWGVDINTGIGENNLGKILMDIREEKSNY